MKSNYPFPCDKCGLCCRRVNFSEITKNLDRGDGVCLNFDEGNNVCKIYENRPDFCRVDVQYELIYSSDYSWSQFVALNLEACESIKKSF